MGHNPNRPANLPPLVVPVPHEPRLLSQNTFPMVTDASTDWETAVAPDPGVLGETPMLFLGLYDLKPEQGFPANQGILSKDWKSMQKVWGSPVLRLATNATKRNTGTNIFGPSLQNDQDLYRNASLSLVFTAWDNTDGEVVWPGRKANPKNPEQNTRLNQVTSQAWMGPNLLPSLAGQSVMSIDLRHWTRGARFIGVWLWPFWVKIAQPPDMDFVWEMWDERPSKDSWPQTWGITWPVRVINKGPISDPPDPADLVFRWGPLPGASAYRLGIFNGDSSIMRIDWERFVGPSFFRHSAVVGGTPVLLPIFDAGGTGTGVPVIYGITHHLVYAANTNPNNFGGPLLLTLSGSPYGL